MNGSPRCVAHIVDRPSSTERKYGGGGGGEAMADTVTAHMRCVNHRIVRRWSLSRGIVPSPNALPPAPSLSHTLPPPPLVPPAAASVGGGRVCF